MIDCALVDRDSSQIDCPQSKRAGAGLDDRTRKRARGEAPEDYAKRDAFKAVRGTRERLQSVPTASITAHFFSIVYYALINVTRELALKPIQTMVPRVYVFGPRAAGDDELRARIDLYDRGVDPELFVNLRNPICWVPYNDQYLVCPSVGEVLNVKTNQLVGAIHSGHGKVHISASGNVSLPRIHVVLSATGLLRPSEKHTGDHVNFTQPLNDSISNIRWATGEQQRDNQRIYPVTLRNEDKQVFVPGLILTPHPVHKEFRVCADGLYQYKRNGVWQPWVQSTPGVIHKRCMVKIKSVYYVLTRVIMECLLGRLLVSDEEVDHIDSTPSNSHIVNLQVVTTASNLEKKDVKLVTGTDSLSTVYGGVAHASQATSAAKGNICTALAYGRNTSGGYSWRDSTVEEVDHFFRAMDALEDLPAAVASLASHPRHGELVRALELRREREAALARLGLCDPPVGWVRGTDGCSGLSFYHREETGECRWRNPTLTRLGL